MSAIDWLSKNAPLTGQTIAQPAPDEPPVTTGVTQPKVTVVPLGTAARIRLGLLPQSVTGLPPDLWLNSDVARLQRMLQSAVSQRLPAAQDLVLTVLLAEADDQPQRGPALDWRVARLDALTALGAVDAALALLGQVEPAKDKVLFDRWMTLALISGSEVAPCSVLLNAPQLSPSTATRIYCTARLGDYDTAALLMGTAAAIGDLPAATEALLSRFLDPDLFAEDPIPQAPVRPDALTFRLYAASGTPLPTAPLPRAFSHADLAEEAGWKAQLEAAERLARASVLSPNRLLGYYSDRRAAASGGIWDRVAALQGFEEALNAKDSEAVSSALPRLWRSMRAAGLEVAFAELFADRLTPDTLDDPAATIARDLVLLSRGYASADVPPDASDRAAFLHSVATGQPKADHAKTAMQRAVVAGFAQDAAPSEDISTLQNGQLGEAILATLGRLSAAGRGDLAALERALVDLRAMALEDGARRTALQALILLDQES